MSRSSLHALCFALLTLPACEEPTHEASPQGNEATEARAHGNAQVGGEIVSTVNGEPITLAEVRETATRLHLSPLDALRRLQSELAIVHRAESTSLRNDAEVEQARQRAAVRALLRTRIEAAHTAEAQSAEAIEARRAEIAAQLVSPERRRSTHALIPLAEDASEAQRDAARRLATRFLAELTLSSDAAATLAQLESFAGEHGAFNVNVEQLPAFARTDVEPAFAEALFGMSAPGLIPQIVQTPYGFHVIYLQDIEPPWQVPREEWEPALRRQLSVEERAEALIALTDELGSRQAVLLHPNLDEIMAQWPVDETSTAPREGP